MGLSENLAGGLQQIKLVWALLAAQLAVKLHKEKKNELRPKYDHVSINSLALSFFFMSLRFSFLLH